MSRPPRSRNKIAEFYPFHTKRAHDVVKREAIRVTTAALASGEIQRQSCEVCKRRKAEAHHDDYAKPLEIRWLCRYHHRQRDAEIRAAWRGEIQVAAKADLPVAYLKRLVALGRPPSAVPPHIRAILELTNRPHRLLSLESSSELVRQATTAVFEAMDAERVSESSLARRAGVSRQYVNTLFSGGFRTLKVLAACADALGYDASFVLRKRKSEAIAS